MDPPLRLDPMTDAERRAFLVEQVEEYAREKTRAGIWREEEASARSRAELSWLLEGAPGKPSGHRFLAARDGAGRRVASVWVGPPPEDVGSGVAYLYQVTVAPDWRGEGVGRATMEALEDLLKNEGARELRLNVFRANAPALALYRGLGFEEAEGDALATRMRKRLA